MKKKKQCIAFLGGGVLVIPSYLRLLEELSKEFEIDLFAEYRNNHYTNKQFKVYKVFASQHPRRWREFMFFMMVTFRLLIGKYNLIHCHSSFPTGFTGVLLGKLFGKKVIVSLDAAEFSAVGDINFGGLLNAKSTRISKWVIGKANLVTALSEFHANDIRNYLTPKVPLEVIPRGIDLSLFPFKPKSYDGEIVLLSVCYLHAVKNPDLLLEVLEILLPKINCRLVHVGADFENGKFRAMAEQKNLMKHINFLGKIPNEQIGSFYRASDFLVHTSRFESQGIVFSEAMASGLPIISTKVGLCADLGEDYCVCVEQIDAQSMANAILKLIEHPELKNKMIQNGRRWVEENELNKTCSIYAQHYQTLSK